jgi:photosystem II stability/assembly factor-like uncharacterized protein
MTPERSTGGFTAPSLTRRGLWLTLAGALLVPVLLAGCAGSKTTGQRHSPLAAEGLSIDELAVDPGNRQTVYALQVGALFKSVNGGVSWRQINFPYTCATSCQTVITAFALASPRNLYLTGVSTVDVAFRSIDGGAHWRRVPDLVETNANTFAVAPSNRLVVYAGLDGGSGQTCAKSTDGGVTWWSCDTAGKPWASIDALAVDPHNSQTVYAVHRGAPFESHVFKTTDGGRNWREIGTNGLAGEGVNTVSVDPQQPRILYAAGMDGVFKSTDAGSHWRLDGLRGQAMFVNQVIVDPRNPRTLYATPTADGVFASFDSGRAWHRLGLAGENVGVLAISYDGRILYAGTDNDGVIAFPVRQR